MSYNPITWGNTFEDIGTLFTPTVPVTNLGITRAGQVASFDISPASTYNPFSKVGEVATAAASVAQLAAFNPYVAGIGATLFGAKFLYDGVKEFF